MPSPAYAFVLRRALEVVLLLCLAQPVLAQTAIKGSVSDRVTGAPLAGVAVELRRGGDILGSAISNPGDGTFLITVDVGNRPEAVNLKLIVARDGYQSQDEDLVVVSGRPRPPVANLKLLPQTLAGCLSRLRPRWVVVGHFRPPLGMPGDSDFSARVSEAVRWELAKIAETSSLAADRRPAVVPCDEVDEREFLAAAARELHADVLLAGGVSRPPSQDRFNVSMFLGDQHGLFPQQSRPILSRDVDLDDPSATRLDATAAAAIVQALLTGYQKDGRFEECVELSRRAGAELQPLPRAIADISAACARALPANGLRGGPQ